MAVFHAVERNVWRRGLLIVLLLACAAAVYNYTGPVERTADGPAVPASAPGPALEPAAEAAGEAVAVSVRVEPIQGGFFDTYRLERDRSRSLQLEQLRQLLAMGERSAADEEAVRQLLALLDRTERELQAEGVLRARGLSEALVVLADQGVIVVVAQPIGAAEAAAIGDAVSRVTGVPLERITISDGLSLP